MHYGADTSEPQAHCRPNGRNRRRHGPAAVGLWFGLQGGAGSSTNQPGNPHSAVTTTDADWKPVADALGHTGKLGDNNTAYRVALVRNDLQVTTDGVPIKPGLSLGGYAAFARYDDNQTLRTGDFILIAPAVQKSTPTEILSPGVPYREVLHASACHRCWR